MDSALKKTLNGFNIMANNFYKGYLSKLYKRHVEQASKKLLL